MKQRGILLAVSILAVAGLLFGVFGCTGTTTPTGSSPASSSPATVPASPSSSAKPTGTTAASPSPAQAQVIKWQAQSAYPPTSSYTINYGVKWAEWVKDVTGGRLVVEVQPTGTFAPAGAMLEALGKGTFDASIDFPGYYAQKLKIADIETGLPMSWKTSYEAYDAFMNRGLYELAVQQYAEFNVYPLGIDYDGSTWYHFGTKFAFNSLDDIKGKKIRATGIYGKYVQALGGSPTTTAAGDMYMSLKTGLLDGMIMGISTLDTYKLAEVLTHYVNEPTLTPLTGSCPLINMDSWKKLPEDIKKLLGNTRYFNGEAALRYEVDSLKTLSSATKNYGLKFVKLSPADEQRAREICIPLWDDVAKANPLAAQAVAIIKQQMKDYGRLQ